MKEIKERIIHQEPGPFGRGCQCVQRTAGWLGAETPVERKAVEASLSSLSFLNSLFTPTAESGFPGGSVSKETTCNARDVGSIAGLKRSPGGGHGNPLQYSCLENSVDTGAWKTMVHRVSKSWTRLE